MQPVDWNDHRAIKKCRHTKLGWEFAGGVWSFGVEDTRPYGTSKIQQESQFDPIHIADTSSEEVCSG